MMICNRLEIVVVPFPFIDMPLSKPRPVLVLSSRHFNQANGHTILSMITTAARSHWPSDHIIQDVNSAGLRTDSLIRWKLFTLDNEIISRKIGVLGKEDSYEVGGMIKEYLL